MTKNIRVHPCSSAVSIGSVVFSPPLVLAPMAGVTNHAFRKLCREIGGVGLVCSEMISAYALTYGSERTKLIMDWTDDERPVSAQLFGPDPTAMGKAARMVEEAGADIIDVNVGCPVPKVTKGGAGGALLRDLALAERIIKAVVANVSVPVTVKTRRGPYPETETAVVLAKIAEAAGVKAVAVHGRTVSQGFSGHADWEVIGRVKESVDIPVIGNGDVRTPEDAARMFDETGCDAVMIGRGALGNPWVFKRIHHYLETGNVLPEPSIEERMDAAGRHASLLIDILGEERAVRELRAQLAWYVKGITGAPKLRAMFTKARTRSDIERILDEARCQRQPGLAEGR